MERDIRNILIVDESASMLFYLGMLLKRLEYRVETVRSAGEALRIMETNMPSLVLTEIMPDSMNGIRLLKQMREDQLLKTVPVIVLTSETDPEIRNLCLKLGCSAYLSKPVEPDLLYRTIQSLSEPMPRAHLRLKASISVTIGDNTTIGGAARDEQAIAISEGGLYVKTSYPQPQNAVTPVRIMLPEREITAKAVVLYSYAIPTGPYREAGMGMKFVELSDTDRTAIRKFIKDSLTRDILPDKI